EAQQLGLDPHAVAKTLIMEDEQARPLIVIMHGDRQVSVKHLARQTGVKKIQLCTAVAAQRNYGYLIGGTSPFATRKPMPAWVEAGLLVLPKIYVNGGRRGMLVGISPRVLTDALDARAIQSAIGAEDE